MFGTVYLKVNIHYQVHAHDNKASYSNWTNPGAGHMILPVNTPVKIKKWRRKGFIIVNTKDNTEIIFEYHKGRMQMSIEEYLRHITSPTEVSLDNLSHKDKKGVKEGVADIGMTKNGVMTALGYPAAHRTPSLDSNTWTYWTNRFGTYVISFDENGIVTKIED